jgi:hypothetical protein
MPPLYVSGQGRYVSPQLRIEIEYATPENSRVLTPYKLVIESNLRYANECHKWELYLTDIPTIEQLYLTLRLTPKVLKEFFISKFDRISDLSSATARLDGLIGKYKNITTFPHPLGYEPQVTGVWYTGEEFVPPPSQSVSPDYFISKILSDLDKLKNLEIEETECKCLMNRDLIIAAEELNRYIMFLNRNCEDFLIFLRFFRDLSKYVGTRESKTSLYKLEKEQFTMLKQTLRTELKRPFELMDHEQIRTILFKMFLLRLTMPYGCTYFLHCPKCNF